MYEFLIPILTALGMGMVSILLRWFQNKLLKKKAESIDTYLKTAREMASRQETKDTIQSAIDINDKLIKKLTPMVNGIFKKTVKFILILITFNSAASITVPRVETFITYSNDTIHFTFTLYNDGADTAFIGSLLITTIGKYSSCDSGHAIITTVPTITDTSLHPIVAPYTLAGKGIYQFVYNFKSSNRLICPPLSITEVGTAALVILNIQGTCDIQILYSTANTPSFIGYATTQTSSLIRNTDWWRFFVK